MRQTCWSIELSFNKLKAQVEAKLRCGHWIWDDLRTCRYYQCEGVYASWRYPCKEELRLVVLPVGILLPPDGWNWEMWALEAWKMKWFCSWKEVIPICHVNQDNHWRKKVAKAEGTVLGWLHTDGCVPYLCQALPATWKHHMLWGIYSSRFTSSKHHRAQRRPIRAGGSSGLLYTCLLLP